MTSQRPFFIGVMVPQCSVVCTPKPLQQSDTGFAFPAQVNYLARDSGLDEKLTRRAEKTVADWRKESRLPFPEFSGEEVEGMTG